MILEAEADLVPMGPRSPLRFGRCRTDVPRTSCGLRSASVGAEQTSPGCLAVFAPLRSAQSRHPPDVLRSSLRFGRRRADIPRMSCGLRSASVGAEQTSPGCLAPHLPQGFGCCGAGAHGSRSRLRLGRCRTDVPPRTSCNPYSARLRLLRGRHQWGQGLAFALYLPR